MKKRILSFLLALLMVVSIFPMPTHAEHTGDESETPTSAPTEAPSENPSENPTSYIAVMADLDNPCCTMDNGSHDATCANYICPACGTGPWHEVCPTIEEPPTEKPTEPEKHPDLGKMVKFNSSWPWAYKSPTNFNEGKQLNVAKFPKVMRVVEVHEVGTSVIYKLETGDGSPWPEAFDGYFYIESIKVTAAVKCSNCDEYECGIDHSATEPTVPENPCDCGCETCTGAEGCECGCENCQFCEKEPENTCECGCETCTGAEGCECKCGNCNFCEKEPENICGCCESCTGAEGCECECGECAFCEKTEEPTVPSISATVVDSNGNEQTVTVSGEALPKGAELVVTPVENEAAIKAELGMAGDFAWDIKVYDTNGNEWQPGVNESVKLSLPFAEAEDGDYAEIIHFLDVEEQIRSALNNSEATAILSLEEYSSAFSQQLQKEIKAYQSATGDFTESVAIISYGEVEIVGGKAVIEVSGFSVFTGASHRNYTSTGSNKGSRIVLPNMGGTYYVTKDSLVYIDSQYTGAKSSWGINGGASALDFYNVKLDTTPRAKARFTVTGNEGADINIKYPYSLNVQRWAYFKVVKEYKLTYNANGGTVTAYTGSGNTTSTAEVVTQDVITYETVSLPIPTKDGYKFKGWSCSNGSTYCVNGAAQDYTVPTGSSNLTFTAQWSPIPYSVTFNANGGSGAPGSQTKYYGENLTLSSTIPTRVGYNFLGWHSSADNVVYQAGVTYSANQATEMTAMWGKTDGNGSWRKNFYVLPGTSGFCNELADIDGGTGPDYGTIGDSNTYYVSPGTTMTFNCSGGQWRIDGSEAGITVKAGSATVGSTAWSAASNTGTVTVSGSAAAGTTFMVYTRTATGTTVNCARFIVQPKEKITTMALADQQSIYRVGVYILVDSEHIPGEPNYTTAVDMINVNGQNFALNGDAIVSPRIANSANYIPSLDGTCTMGVVDYTGRGTLPFLDDTVVNRAMDRVIEELKKTSGGKTLIAVDGVNLNSYYATNGEDAVRENYAVRPHIVKLMTGLDYGNLGWHIDCTIYPQQTVTLTYNLNPPVGYVLKDLGTPSPSVYTGDIEAKPAKFTVTTAIPVDKPVTASVSGSSDTASLTFAGWNTKPDGTGTSYNPGSTITLTEDDMLYAQWTGKTFTTGTLEIYKTVTVGTGSQNPGDDTFSFSINLSGSYSYTVFNATTGSQISNGTMTNGNFTLKNNQFIRFTQVPVATYTVKETLPTDYNNEDFTQTVELKGGYVNQLFFTNEYDKPLENKVTYQYTNTTVPEGAADLLPEDKTYGYGEEVTIEEEPSLPGYAFTGWTPNVTLTIDSETNTFSMPDKAVVFSGTWTLTEYIITYNHNDAVNGGQPTTSTEKYTIESTNVKLKTPTRDGYKFTGWKLETGLTAPKGNWAAGIYKAETAVTKKYGNVILVAQWEVAEADLTIYAKSDDPDHNFLINVAGNGINLTVAIPAGGSVTIKNLPVGNYTVKEVTDSWSWRIDDQITKTNVEVKGPDDQGKPANNQVTFDFGANDNKLWLNGYSYGKKGG